MKKKIYTLLCLCVFGFAEAQNNDIKTANTLIEKVHDRVNQIKAAEFLVKTKSPLEKGETSPFNREIKGFFKVVPDDKAAGCHYFVQFYNQKMMYDGKNSYNIRTYEESLNIADTKKYPEEAKLKLMSPNPFQNLLDIFEYQYQQPTGKEENQYEMKVTVSTEKDSDQIYYAISCEVNYIFISATTTTTIYLTKDYLPVKLTLRYSDFDEASYIIEKYSLLDTIPDTQFSISLMEPYHQIARYEEVENGYIREEK